MNKVAVIFAILFILFDIAFVWLQIRNPTADAVTWVVLVAINAAFFTLAWYNLIHKKDETD